MLNRLFSTIKRGSKKIGQGGYTLIEVAAVVAITATLAAVVVPIAVDKVKEGKVAAATTQCKQIGAAIGGFVKDTGEFPHRNLSGLARTVQILWSGESIRWTPPTFATPSPGWPLISETDANSRLFNHLGSGGFSRYKTIAGLDWKGPYLDEIGTDPWGRPYLVLSKGFYYPAPNPNAPANEFGWILSAGPNGKVETYANGSVLNADSSGTVQADADDIGIVIYRYQPAQTGL